MKAATCVPTFQARAAFYLQLVTGKSVENSSISIDPPKLNHSWYLRWVLPLIGELFRHLRVFRIPIGKLQDCWHSAERGSAAASRTEVALFTTNFNCWHLLAKKTGVCQAAFDSRASVTIGTKTCHSPVWVDISSVLAPRNGAHIFAWRRARPRLTGTPTVVIELSGAPQPAKIVRPPILNVNGLGIAVLAQGYL